MRKVELTSNHQREEFGQGPKDCQYQIVMGASTTHRDLGDKIPRTPRERESREKKVERKRRRNSNLKSAGKLMISKNVAQII